MRERLRPGSEEAYNANELRIAETCAALDCPHPYLALATTTGPKEVWWLNAFVSREERDGIDSAYARNERLTAELRPLGKRKEDVRDRLSTTMTEYRPDSSGGAVLRIAGARYFVIDTIPEEGESTGAVFESEGGARFAITSTASVAVVRAVAARSAPGAITLAVQPQWSFPAEAWIVADPEFWSSNPVARKRRPSRNSR